MTKQVHQYELEAGGLTFSFLNSGDLYQASSKTTMINQLLPHAADGALGNLYLRLHREDGIRAIPLLGIRSGAAIRRTERRMIWNGIAEGIGYQVVFTLTEQGIWFWDVTLEGGRGKADVVYGQDIGIAAPGAVRSNEAYLSQYIDHSVFQDEEWGYVVCSRQNQPQGGRFPYLQQGALTGSTGFSTDGFQFFGLSYKETNVPEALTRANPANEVYQYEFAYTALQTEAVELGEETTVRFVFYGLFKEDHPSAINGLEFRDDIRAARDEAESPGDAALEVLPRAVRSPEIGKPLTGRSLTAEDLDRLFPQRKQEERADGQLLSFFTNTYEHVVLKEKELRIERPHGHILMSGGNDRMNSQVITTTSYMYGVFNSQVVIGNTNFNKLMSNTRNALNVAKTSGQRVYVEQGGAYRLLTMPSAFEMGFNYVRWYYQLTDDLLTITNYTRNDSPEVVLHFASAKNKAYRCLVTNQITMHVNEFEIPYRFEVDGENAVIFRADPSALSAGAEAYPDLQYRMEVSGGTGMKLSDDRKLVSLPQSEAAPLAVLELDPAASWALTIRGQLDGEEAAPSTSVSAEEEIARYREFFRGVMNGFRLYRSGGDEGELFKVNALAWWYTHNMLVHYSMPHGLEQYGGAAWGTRDVCQGPVEYFLATRKYDRVREILLTVFAHQYEDDGNWPQWFMFDNYTRIQQEESHGDIIVWPLKVLGDYLAVTGDYGILEERIPYTRKGSFDFTAETATLMEHAEKEIGYIRQHFLHGTHLSSYGDGDWDDTLQPANAQLKQYMVSSWTVALTYQTVGRFAQVLSGVRPEASKELASMADGIRADFGKYMLGTGVIPGFVYMERPDEAKLMLHPSDTETGIQYRLLPMTRSMISELLTPEQAEEHYRLIREQFYCPDGVRLMNRPAQYAGGVSTHFKRAEQASNFGREIGLQYVHAHIRYVEAMAKLGKQDEVWRGLEMINPVGLSEVVPNAELRQANAYFSSSDGKFSTRYEAQERFNELRSGAVPVKGGWRIYSSGPGIYMNQLISQALGVREEGGDLILDPVLPESLDGAAFDFEVAGLPATIVYRLTGRSAIERITVNGREAAAEPMSNRYRAGGVRIGRAELERLAESQRARQVIEIHM
ncbi:GH36-type glycosyl hydrolase domain-containing protein [Paenibacillus sp. A14]|uniref:GH36-type glycosyl hydrolase domain-containing protein n=1 Tax=Paenibacillus sp. A14 TaxID=3119820 RepID=UPI002FDFF34E